MNEKEVMALKFGETVADGNGNKYTKTIGGWIYQTFTGQVCFVPEVTEEEPIEEKPITEKADKKEKEK